MTRIGSGYRFLALMRLRKSIYRGSRRRGSYLRFSREETTAILLIAALLTILAMHWIGVMSLFVFMAATFGRVMFLRHRVDRQTHDAAQQEEQIPSHHLEATRRPREAPTTQIRSRNEHVRDPYRNGPFDANGE
jgi:hypothetical protein